MLKQGLSFINEVNSKNDPNEGDIQFWKQSPFITAGSADSGSHSAEHALEKTLQCPSCLTATKNQEGEIKTAECHKRPHIFVAVKYLIHSDWQLPAARGGWRRDVLGRRVLGWSHVLLGPHNSFQNPPPQRKGNSKDYFTGGQKARQHTIPLPLFYSLSTSFSLQVFYDITARTGLSLITLVFPNADENGDAGPGVGGPKGQTPSPATGCTAGGTGT